MGGGVAERVDLVESVYWVNSESREEEFVGKNRGSNLWIKKWKESGTQGLNLGSPVWKGKVLITVMLRETVLYKPKAWQKVQREQITALIQPIITKSTFPKVKHFITSCSSEEVTRKYVQHVYIWESTAAWKMCMFTKISFPVAAHGAVTMCWQSLDKTLQNCSSCTVYILTV